MRAAMPEQNPLPLQNDDCRGPLPREVVQGLELFNHGEYFEAHEALETAWRAERGPVRDLYRGILQIGVAYYHLLNGNYSGAVKLFQRYKQYLEPFADGCKGIALDELRRDAERAEAELLRLGSERMHQFNRALLRPVRYRYQPDTNTEEQA